MTRWQLITTILVGSTLTAGCNEVDGAALNSTFMNAASMMRGAAPQRTYMPTYPTVSRPAYVAPPRQTTRYTPSYGNPRCAGATIAVGADCQILR